MMNPMKWMSKEEKMARTKKDFKIVIFGHTHKARIDKDSFLVADRIYGNTGCWSQKKAHHK